MLQADQRNLQEVTTETQVVLPTSGEGAVDLSSLGLNPADGGSTTLMIDPSDPDSLAQLQALLGGNVDLNSLLGGDTSGGTQLQVELVTNMPTDGSFDTS